jgi:undecaprenyl-diphosphatase
LATAAWGAIVFTAGASAGWRRRIALAAGAAMITITVGVTRLYLGVHWLTEVIGGWTLGAAWLAITTITARKATAPQ